MARTQTWFEADRYFSYKTDQLNAINYQNQLWSVDRVQAFFTEHNIDAYDHFVQYGNQENVSPNHLFVVAEYLAAKAEQLNNYANADGTTGYQSKTDWDEASVQEAFNKAGLSAWDHYLQYGAKEGINPSNAFNQDVYYNAKAQALNAMNNGKGYGDNGANWTADLVEEYFIKHNVNPLEHYITYAGTTDEVAISLDVTVLEALQVSTDPTYDVYTETEGNAAVTELTIAPALDKSDVITAAMTVENAIDGTVATVIVDSTTNTLTFDGTRWRSSSDDLAYDGTTLTYTRPPADVGDATSNTYTIASYAGKIANNAMEGTVTSRLASAFIDCASTTIEDTEATITGTLTLNDFTDDTSLAIQAANTASADARTLTFTATIADDGTLTFAPSGIVAEAVEGKSGVYTLTYTRPTDEIADQVQDVYDVNVLVDGAIVDSGTISSNPIETTSPSALIYCALDTIEDTDSTITATLTLINCTKDTPVAVQITKSAKADSEAVTYAATLADDGSLTFEPSGLVAEAVEGKTGVYTLTYTRPADDVDNQVKDIYNVKVLVDGKIADYGMVDTNPSIETTSPSASIDSASYTIEDTEATITGILTLNDFTDNTSLAIQATNTASADARPLTFTATIADDGTLTFEPSGIVAEAVDGKNGVYTLTVTRPSDEVGDQVQDVYDVNVFVDGTIVDSGTIGTTSVAEPEALAGGVAFVGVVDDSVGTEDAGMQ
ncbi:MAG: hypothetical protein IJS54_07870 [Desulfovibrio sp.]|nr:hypothetical protein [Desulfovibrio sp.]